MDSQTQSNIHKAIEDFEKSVNGKSKFKRLRVRFSGWTLYVDGVDAGMRNTMVFDDPLTTAVGAGVTQGIGYVANRTKTISLENTRSYLSAFFQWLIDEEVILKNPMSKIKTIKFKDEIKKPFSAVEIDALRGACETKKRKSYNRIIIIFWYTCV